MSVQPETSNIPEWDLADRMRKALRHAGITPGDMAAYLEVGGNTVSTWINGRIKPSKQTLRLWAFRTGVDRNWLCHGDSKPCGPGTKNDVFPGQQGGMIPCSWQGQTDTNRSVNLAMKHVLLPDPLAA